MSIDTKIIFRKLIEQGGPAMTTGGSCRYREGERRCAVGWLIPDELYRSQMEGQDVYSLVATDLRKADLGIENADDWRNVCRMQNAHDAAAQAVRSDNMSWEGALTRAWDEHNLERI